MLDRASVLVAAGRLEEFAAQRRELARAGPDHRLDVADGLWAAAEERWPEALAAFRRALERRPDDVMIRSRVFHLEMERGRRALARGGFEEAQGAYDAARALFPSESRAQLEAARVRLRGGRPVDALEVLRDLPPGAPGVSELVFDTATVLVDSHQDALALWALRAAVQADGAGTLDLLRSEPAWAARRSDPRILEILALVGGPGAGLTGSK
ncbi:MAG: tetratricopeptide repeat protein [Planctomycetota bacterium]